MATTPGDYLAVLKASYDYQPQPDAEDEIAIKEDQLLFLLEKVDDDWWKVKVKLESQDEEGPAGLVPAAYVEPAQPISIVKALYDYEANADGELSLQEEEILEVYAKDDDWFLVSQKEGGKIGYIPGNYVEETSAEGATGETSAASPPTSGVDFSKLVIPEDPPKPAYTDPTELVNRSKGKTHGGPVETWSISEVDKKGKKKKGTLGVGNGSMFFASESDKTPVQKWQASDIQSTRVEKSKHVHIEISGPNAAELHFHAGSKEVAEAIIAKLQEARTDAKAVEAESEPAAALALAVESTPERPRSAAAKSVHFDNSEPEIIPDHREDEAEVGDQEEEEPEDTLGAGERAVVLYDFAADGDDEMTVHEGETLLVLERDTDEWWKCKNAKGEEGVVPANYLELVPGSGGPQPSIAVEDGKAAREAEDAAVRAEAERRVQEEVERKAKEIRKAEAEQRAKAAAAQAEADRKKREQERERQREKEKEREAAAAAAERLKQKQKRDSDSGSSSKSKGSGESSRSSQDRRRPAPEDTRVWHDRTGQFRVEAAFLGYSNGKLRLHKANGVIIEVPSEKMSAEDMAYIEKMSAKRKTSSPRRNSDDEPLADRRKSLQPQPRPTSQAAKKGPTIDWFEFFLNAGCDVDDCSRYAQSFERDKIDEALLPDITEGTMRSLGLREGDIIRVKKHIDQKYPNGKPSDRDAKADQLRRDEELAKQLQAEENTGATRGQAPNLFTSPSGELKNNVRRGRPQPSKSLPPATVDLNSISNASDQIQRSGTPLVSSPVRTGGTPAPAPPKSASPAPAALISGFDDDAWTNRPASTKPTPSPAPARAASVPPAPAPPPVQAAAPALALSPPPAQPTPPVPPASAPPAPAPANSLANKTEADVFDQLARLAAIRTQSPAVVNRSVVSPPTVVSPPPVGYHSGLGVGPSPSPMAQHLQAQQTGFLPPPAINGPRGPLAPVPANQSLLQPLVPTPTGLGAGFVPTRQSIVPSPFQTSPSPSFLTSQPTGFAGASQPLVSQPTGFQPQQPLGPQPTGFQPSLPSFQPSPSGFQPQPTGFQPQPTGFQPQFSGFQPQGPILSQPTGLPGPGFGNGMNGQFNGLQGNGSFTPVQSNPTGFNPSFASPPPPSQQQQQSVNTNPANVFAQMKSGTFGSDNSSAPKDASQYDALRPQPTGWVGGYQGTQGFGGFGYQ